MHSRVAWRDARECESTCVDCFSLAVDDSLENDSNADTEESDDSDQEIEYIREVSLESPEELDMRVGDPNRDFSGWAGDLSLPRRHRSTAYTYH